MISVVFVIAVLNLMLGFALAMLLERQIVLPWPSLSLPAGADSRDVVLDLPAAYGESFEEVRQHLPRRWLDVLEASDIQCDTFMEAAFEVVQRDIATYRSALLDMEDRLREALDRRQVDAVQDAIRQLVTLNEGWIDHQNQALTVLAQGYRTPGTEADICRHLEAVLLDQTSLLEEHCVNLSGLDLHRDTAPGVIVQTLSRLTGLAHALRDELGKTMLPITCRARWPEAAQGGQLHADDMTGLPNRVGLELAFCRWWHEDDKRERMVSAALVDIDRFGEFNHRVGTRVADRVLRHIATCLQQLIGSEGGAERVFRYDGQRFFILLGDCGPHTAVGRIETLRNTIAATRLEYLDRQYTLTIRAGVTDVRSSDSMATLCERLEQLTDAGRRAGRNCTCLDDASGNSVVPADETPVPTRVIRVL